MNATLENKVMLKWNQEAIFLDPGEKVDVIDFLPPDRIVIGKGLFRGIIGQDNAIPEE